MAIPDKKMMTMQDMRLKVRYFYTQTGSEKEIRSKIFSLTQIEKGWFDLNEFCSITHRHHFSGIFHSINQPIFEGDILDSTKYADDSPAPYEVVFEDGCFRRSFVGWDQTLKKPLLTQADVDLLNDVVIGNVAQTPELLIKEKQR